MGCGARVPAAPWRCAQTAGRNQPSGSGAELLGGLRRHIDEEDPGRSGPSTLTAHRRGRYGATEVQPKEERVNKSGLITEVAKRTGASKADVSRFLEATMGTIRENVAKGNRVALSGFGTFERKHRNKRVARNPRKPDVPIVVPARDIPSFNPGNEFRDAIASKRRKSATKKR